jgi:enoyl-CoA hydratase/carnithine racemase
MSTGGVMTTETTETQAGYGTLVLLDKSDRVGRITFNRPEKRNAMSTLMQAELRAALEATKDCTVVTISGGDGPAYCSGIDLAEGRNRDPNQPRPRSYSHSTTDWAATCKMIADHPAICIASVNGYALGGGTSLIHCCDLAIASEKAELGTPEMGFGTFPGLAAPLLAKRVLPKHLNEIVFMVQRISAQDAHRMGIINWVVPHESLAEETEKLAQRMAVLDPILVDWSKRGIQVLEHVSWELAPYLGSFVNSQARAQGSQSTTPGILTGQPGLGQGVNQV